MSEHTTPSSDKTGDRDVASGAGPAPTEEESTYADEAAATAPDVSEAYSQEAKVGAAAKGEGQIEG